MRVGYCTPSDLFDYGLPRGAVPNPARSVSAAAAGPFVLGEHGLSLNDLVSFRADAGGTLPAPLATATDYFAIPLTADTFAVSATSGGAAIALTTAAVRAVMITHLPVAKSIEWGAAIIDDGLPAHLVPLVAPFPPIIVMTNAELAAGKLMQGKGEGSPSLAAMVDLATKRVARWAQGVPVRGTNAEAQGHTQMASSAVAPYVDARGWSKFGGL